MLPVIVLVVTLTFCVGAVTVSDENAGNTTQLQDAATEYKILKQRLDDLQSTISKLLTFTEKARQENQKVQHELIENVARLHTKRNITNCKEAVITGKYFLRNPDNLSVFPVVCEADAFDGGWLVVQQRIHGGLKFYRGWNDYKNGFGSVAKSNEFWIGLEWMHQYTKDKSCELAVELRDESSRYGYALYSEFKIADESDNYRLSKDFDFIEGSIGDKMFKSRNEQFSTPERNNDKYKKDCGFKYESGWWFFDCESLNLNGLFKKDSQTGRGIFWNGWTDAATFSRMMIRCMRQPSNEDAEPLIDDCRQAEGSGINSLKLPVSSQAITVFCEAESYDGGWLVIQQRIDGTVDFNRNWSDYKQGFGVVGKSSEFWLGLEQIHQLTKSDDYDLLIEVKNESGKYGYALYNNFKIAGEGFGYRIKNELSRSEGTIFGFQNFKGRFSTPDRDNDNHMFQHCGSKYKSGWWFFKCEISNLNGPYNKDPETGRGIFWHDWADAGTYSRMMIRRT